MIIMPEVLYFIKANKEKDEHLYRIMKRLELEGECLLNDVKGSKWHGAMTKFGVRAKPLIEKDLIEPIWIQRKTGNYPLESRLIRTKKNIEIKEVTKGKLSEFYFKPIEIDNLHKKRRKLI